MKTRTTAALCIASAIGCVLLAGCAGPATCVKEDGDKGVALEYRLRPDQPLRYRVSSQFDQTTEVRGQTALVTAAQDASITVVTVDESADVARVRVTLDSVRVRITAPETQLEPGTSGVDGQSFEMNVSPLGVETDFPGPEAIQYDLGPQGKRSAISMFQSMFPDLAGHPVRVGDSWTTRSSMDEGSEGQAMLVEIESENVLDGFEIIGGLECARVKATYKGTLSGSGAQGPAEWTTDGTMEGTSTWYFAHEEGLFVSERTEGTGKSTVTVKRPDGETMTIPTSSVTLIETTLLR